MENCMSLFGFDLCGKREMQGFLRIKRDWKERCGKYCTFIHLCGFLAPLFLEEFHWPFYTFIG